MHYINKLHIKVLQEFRHPTFELQVHPVAQNHLLLPEILVRI